MPLFVAAFSRRLGSADYRASIEVLDAFELLVCKDPRAAGQQHRACPDWWIYEAPRVIRRLPRIALLYSIDDEGGFVRLWNVQVL